MPVAYRHDPEIEAIVLTVSGALTDPERRIMIRVAELMLSELGIRKIIVDCSRLTKEGNIEQAFGFAALLKERADIFRELRMAVIPAPDFFYLPSVAVGNLQSAGVTVVEREDIRGARAWLAEDLSGATDAA